MKMKIENFEALREWLTSTLEPICDADPSALANYVLALVKKNKSERELKALCIDQLDGFLQKETHGFVDKLFEALNNKSYLPPLELPPIGAIKGEFLQHPDKEVKKEEEMVSHGGKTDRRLSNSNRHELSNSNRHELSNSNWHEQSVFSNWNNRHRKTSDSTYGRPPLCWNSEKDSRPGCSTEPPAAAPAAPGNPHRNAMIALQSKVNDYESEVDRLKKELKASNDYVKDLETQVATLKRKIKEQDMCPTCD